MFLVKHCSAFLKLSSRFFQQARLHGRPHQGSVYLILFHYLYPLSIIPASSKWAAWVVRHLNKYPHLFSVTLPLFTFIGSKKSTPVFVNGGSLNASHSLGKDAITGISGFSLLLLQCRQSLTIFLMNDFPHSIQNCPWIIPLKLFLCCRCCARR